MGGPREDPGGKAPNIDPEAGGSVDPIILPEGFGASFSDKVIRARFVRKVYAILLSQPGVTTAFVAVFCFTPAIRNFYCDDSRKVRHVVGSGVRTTFSVLPPPPP